MSKTKTKILFTFQTPDVRHEIMAMSTSKGIMKYMSGESVIQQRMVDQGVNPHIRDYSVRILLPLAPQQRHALEISAFHYKEESM